MSLYQMPGVADTVDVRQCQQHYYRSQPSIGPSDVVPVGPSIDFAAPHHRAQFSK